MSLRLCLHKANSLMKFVNTQTVPSDSSLIGLHTANFPDKLCEAGGPK